MQGQFCAAQRALEWTGHNSQGLEWEKKPGKQMWMCWKPSRGEGLAFGASAGESGTAQGGKFPLDQLANTTSSENLLSRSP